LPAHGCKFRTAYGGDAIKELEFGGGFEELVTRRKLETAAGTPPHRQASRDGGKTERRRNEATRPKGRKRREKNEGSQFYCVKTSEQWPGSKSAPCFSVGGER